MIANKDILETIKSITEPYIDYEHSGSLERMRDAIDKTQEATTALLIKLVEKNILSINDLEDLY